MRNGPWAKAPIVLLCLLSTCLAGAQQSGQTPPEQNVVVVGKRDISRWFRAESQHFVVYSDTADDDVAQLLDNLEKLDHLLRIYTRPVAQPGQPPQKLTLYYHRRLADLREIDGGLPADAVGLYSSCASGVRGFGVHFERIAPLGDAQLDKSPLNESLSYAFEAYTRYFLYRHTDIRAPNSFIDGFAQYFSSVRFSEKQMVLGRVPKSIGAYLRFLDEGRVYSLEYADVLEQNTDHARNFAGAAGVRLEFEAKSWLLTHYMLSSADHRQRLNRYLGLVGRGLSPTTAFERAFALKSSDIGKALSTYRRRGMEALRVEHPALPSARVTVRSLPRAAGEFVLADAALKSCPGRQAGASLLKKIALLAGPSPDDDLARLTLSRAQIDWGNAMEALPHLSAVLKDDDAHFEARYLLGLANLRLAGQHEGEVRRSHLDAAQHHLQRALASNPRSPEAAFAVFKAEVAAGDELREAALQGVIEAWQSAREVNALARFAALAYAYAGSADEARHTLGALAQNTRDVPMAQWAKQWQGRLDAGVSRGDILAEMRRDPAPDAAFKQWTIDKEGVMLAVSRNHGLQSAEAFIRERARENPEAPANDPRGGNPNR